MMNKTQITCLLLLSTTNVFVLSSCQENISVADAQKAIDASNLKHQDEQLESSSQGTAEEISDEVIQSARLDISFDSEVFDEEEISAGSIKVLVSYFPYKPGETRQNSNAEGTVRYKIFADGKEYIDTEEDVANGFGSFYFRNLDDDQIPELIVETNVGGAHCCTVISTYSWQGSRFVEDQQIVDANDEPLRDLNGDGKVEFIASQGGNFVGTFGGGHAGSIPPSAIYTFEKGKFEDTTREHIEELRDREELILRALRDAEQEQEIESSERNIEIIKDQVNGLLASYVAQKILLGEYKEGWEFMLENYFSDTTSGIAFTQIGKEGGHLCDYTNLPAAIQGYFERIGFFKQYLNNGDELVFGDELVENRPNAEVVGDPEFPMKNVRQTPEALETDENVLFELPIGSSVKVLQSTRNEDGYLWYKLYSPDKDAEGWIANHLIEFDQCIPES